VNRIKSSWFDFECLHAFSKFFSVWIQIELFFFNHFSSSLILCFSNIDSQFFDENIWNMINAPLLSHNTCIDNYPRVNSDLNSIDNMWCRVSHFLQRYHRNSQQYLEELVKVAWNAILRNVCHQITASQCWEITGW